MQHNLKKDILMSSSGPFCVKEKTTAGVCVCGGGGSRTAEESEEAAFHAPAACQISEAALAQIMVWRD